jgi:tetratricopeptide (TPR) repeat protein
MSRSTWFLTAALVGTQVALVQPAVMAAKSAAEVESIARAVTVEIKLQQDSSVGSGIIIARSGDLYTIATNRHVVCGKGSRKQVPTGETYALGLADGQKYRVKAASVKLIGTDLDLALVQFRSSRKYPTAQIDSAGGIKVTDVVYTAGFPLAQPGFSFNQGNVIAVIDRRITGDRGGYSMIYDAYTLPGMSGGGVFNANGRLVAIHGQGERFGENTEIGKKSFQVGSKIGYNRGIPIRRLMSILANAGMKISDNRPPAALTTTRSQVSASADEYFIAGFNKFVEPGDDLVAGKRVAIQELSKAIQINPRYMFAYLIRAYVYAQLQESRQSLSDYDRAISLNPQFAIPYYNRALLKDSNLNDVQGALIDYNQAIIINPRFGDAYYNRALLKYTKRNDVQGALNDLDRAIALTPKFIDLEPRFGDAYYSRALLKINEFNDVQGALNDYNQAIIINPKFTLAYNNRGILKVDKLNDIQGALIDFNQAIALNHKSAEAYGSRGILKVNKLNDKAGAIQDLRQAANLFQEQGQTQSWQRVVGILRQLGVAE